MPVIETLKLPAHIENRRADILRALDVRRQELEIFHAAAIKALTGYNEAVDLYNRSIYHADGWCIEAAAVIEIDLIGRYPPGFEETAEGRAALLWLQEFEQIGFDKLDRLPLPPLPPLTQGEDLNALPRFPDDPNKH